jgi:predicted porin
MKKSLIALAVLTVSGASFAQSSVQLDGVVDAGYQAIDYKGNKINGIAGNGSSTSQLNIRGTEDLGGGLKANFRMETDWNMGFNRANTGAAGSLAHGAAAADVALTGANAAAGSFGNGELRVGVSGGFGAIDAGTVNMNGLTSYLTGQPFGTAIGGGYASIARVDSTGAAVRSDNSVKYTSPSFSGLNVTLYKANKQTKGANANDNFSSTLGRTDMAGSTEVGLNYANGPLAASFSNLKQDFRDVASTGTTLGTTESTVNTLGVNYTMGAAKFFLLNQTNKATGTGAATDTKYTTVSATYTMGATTLMAQAGSLKADAGANAGKKSDILGLGADYALSKRTAVYARYESIDDKAGVVAITGFTAATGNTTRTRTAVGVRHAF